MAAGREHETRLLGVRTQCLDERKAALDKIMKDKSGLIEGYEKKMD